MKKLKFIVATLSVAALLFAVSSSNASAHGKKHKHGKKHGHKHHHKK